MNKCSIYMALLASLLVVDNGFALNKTDKKGRQGQWVKTYPNGKTMYEGQFKNDVPFGVFKRYTENGTLQSVQTYQKGDESTVVFYEADGKTVSTEGAFKGKLKVGEWKYYSKGELILTELYVDGKKNGVSKSYKEGKLLEETPYKDDLKDGVEKAYLPDGKLYAESSYLKGKLHGPYKMYEGNDKPVETGDFKDGNRHGKWIIYDENGKQLEEAEYVNGQLQNKKELQKEQASQLKQNEKNKGKFVDPADNMPKE